MVICFLAASAIPLLAAASRRVHDIGRAATWLFALLFLRICTDQAFVYGTLSLLGEPRIDEEHVAFPLIALFSIALNILIIWWLARPSTAGPNAYGPNPHEVTP